jgi:hypothetical protein
MKKYETERLKDFPKTLSPVGRYEARIRFFYKTRKILKRQKTITQPIN